MIKEDKTLTDRKLLNKNIIQLRDGKPVYKAKILDTRCTGLDKNGIPLFDLHIIRFPDGKESTITSRALFNCIREGTVKWETKGESYV